MRLFRRLSRLSPLLVPLSSAVLLACFDSSNPPPPGTDQPEPDGGAPIADATTPDASQIPDGGVQPVAETGTDAPAESVPETGAADDPAAPPPPVTVLVTSVNGPEAGRLIVFHDASGQVIATATTDATGLAAQEILPSQGPVQVTAVLGGPLRPNLFTVTGVQPGEQLAAFDGPAPETASVDVTVPQVLDAGPIDSYYVNAGNCETFADGNEGVVQLDPACVGPAGFPLLVLAEGETGTVAYLSEKSNTLPADAGSTPAVTVAGDWQYSTGTATVDVTNVPESAFPTLSYSEVANGVPYTNTDYEPSFDDPTYESHFETHPGYPDFVQTEADLNTSLDDDNAFVTQAVANRADAPTSASPSPSVTFDDAEFPPNLTTAAVDASAPSRPSVSWATSSAISGGVAAIVSLHWTSTDDAGDVIGGNWTIVTAAPGASPASVQFPALPDAASAYAPGDGATWPDDNPTVAILAGPAAGTYDALRKTAAVVGSNLDPFNGAVVPPLPASGRAQVSLYYRQVQEGLSLRRRR